MPRRPSAHCAAAGAALILALTACTAAEPEPTPSKTAAAPIFASDEEALAAVEHALDAFFYVGSRIANDGGSDPDRVSEVASGQELAEALEFFDTLAENGLRFEGEYFADRARLDDWWIEGGLAVATAYYCIDVSGTTIVNETGDDVTPERRDRTPYFGTFTSKEIGSGQLTLNGSNEWSSDDFCN